MPQDRRRRHHPRPAQAMEVAAAERAGDDLHNDLRPPRGRQRHLAQLERPARAMKEQGGRRPRHEPPPTACLRAKYRPPIARVTHVSTPITPQVTLKNCTKSGPWGKTLLATISPAYPR